MESKTIEVPKQEYTAELKEFAVKRVKEGLTPGAATKELGLVEQTLRNWVKAADAGKLNGLGTKLRDAGANGTLPPARGERQAQAGV